MNGKENTMTLHIQMLYEVAKSAKAMADAMQAIVDDCAEQLALRKVSGETDEEMLNEVFGQPKAAAAVTPPAEPAPAEGKTAAPEKPKLTIVELRAFVAERSTPENRPKIKAILTKFGVKKLTELPEEKYAAVMEEVAAL